jgi:hypothetical protein
MSTYSIPHPAVRSLTAPRLFVAATAAVVVHIADAELLQPQPGTHPRDHLLATLVPVGIAVAAAVAFDRVRPGVRAAIAGIFGSLSLVAGLIAVGGVRADGISGAEWTGLLLVPAGTMLLGLAVCPWSERGRWTWGRVVDAAIDLLKQRDVRRIGALGLSTGADVLIEVAARRHDPRAVVADGATAHSTSDTRRISHAQTC